MATVDVPVQVPEGWPLGDLYEENLLCPEHAPIKDFKSSQCVGCVEGWGDCSLWEGFAYEYRRNITPRDLSTLREGRCPRRTNGTMTVTRVGISPLDLSSEEREAGAALADAIEAYIEQWPSRDGS